MLRPLCQLPLFPLFLSEFLVSFSHSCFHFLPILCSALSICLSVFLFVYASSVFDAGGRVEKASSFCGRPVEALEHGGRWGWGRDVHYNLGKCAKSVPRGEPSLAIPRPI